MTTTNLDAESIERLMREVTAIARSGMPLSAGLGALADPRASNSALARSAAMIRDSLNQGKSLSEALRQANPTVPDDVIALVRAGETAGDLAPMSDFAADTARRTLRTRATLETLTAYPVTIIAVALLVYAQMVFFVMKQVVGIYTNLSDQSLPLITRVIYWPLFFNFGSYVVLGGVFVALFLLTVMLVPRLRFVLWSLGSHLPGLRGLGQVGDVGALMAFASAMTSRGVPLPEAMEAAVSALATPQGKASARAMAKSASNGGPISPFLPTGVPATIGLILESAERHGKLPETFASLDSWCRDYFTLTEQRAVNRLEPAILIMLGILAATLIGAAYFPLILSMTRIGE